MKEWRTTPETSRPGVRFEEEGLRVATTIERAVNVAREYGAVPLLAEKREVTAEDARRVEDFLLSAFPPDGENYRTHSHLQLTGEFAARIAEKLGYNPHEFRTLGLLHDAGRLLTHPEGVNPHRYFRNDGLGDVLLRKLSIPRSIREQLQPHRSYLHPEEFTSIDAFTPAQRIVIIADICGKRKDDSTIQSLEETLEYHYASRGSFSAAASGPWPSENAARKTLSTDVVKQWGKHYEDIAAWLQREYKVDITDVRSAIEEREKQLPVDTLVWDVGGVLILDSDPVIIRDFCHAFHLDEETLVRYWDELIPALQRGEKSTDAFWKSFGERIECPVTPDQRDMFTRSFDGEIIPAMQSLLLQAKSKGYSLYALSDTIPQHRDALRQSGAYDAFEDVFLSPNLRCSKKSGSTFQRQSELAAWRVACLRMRKFPQQCLFLDDKMQYVEAAKKASMKAAQVRSPEEAEAVLRAFGIL